MEQSAFVEGQESRAEVPAHHWREKSETGFTEESKSNGFALFASALP